MWERSLSDDGASIKDGVHCALTLWRVLEGHPIQYYDVQVPWYNDFVIYDLHSGAYISNGLQNEVGAPWKFGVKAQASDLNGDALRRMGTK